MSKRLAINRSATAAIGSTLLAAIILSGATVYADNDDDKNACSQVPTLRASSKQALDDRPTAESNGGFNLDMWGSIVNRDGIVCAVAFTGDDRGCPMAGQPSHLRAEGEHRQFVQPAAAWPCRPPTCGRPCSPVARCSACRRAIRSTPARRTRVRRPSSARQTIRWSATRSAASTCSAAGWRSTTPPARWLARSASAATRPAPTTTSPGARDTN